MSLLLQVRLEYLRLFEMGEVDTAYSLECRIKGNKLTNKWEEIFDERQAHDGVLQIQKVCRFTIDTQVLSLHVIGFPSSLHPYRPSVVCRCGVLL